MNSSSRSKLSLSRSDIVFSLTKCQKYQLVTHLWALCRQRTIADLRCGSTLHGDWEAVPHRPARCSECSTVPLLRPRQGGDEARPLLVIICFQLTRVRQPYHDQARN